MKIVVACDSFKGSLSSAEVGAAIKNGIIEIMADAEVEVFSVADGGEGTVEALMTALGGEWRQCAVQGPMGDTVVSRYGVSMVDGEKTAIIEVAAACGLPLVGEKRKDIMTATTRGVGQLIVDAWQTGCRHFVIGLGGSATCDGGIGMLSELGIQLRDKNGMLLPPMATSLGEVAAIDESGARKEILNCRFDVITDVDNPLCGERGAARMFAPQKGATPTQVEELDKGLRNYSKQLERRAGRDVVEYPGAGAAGGLGATFYTFFKTQLISGAEAVLDMMGIDNALKEAEMVITGEGKMDCQTVCGKLPMEVCRHAKRYGIPVTAFAGIVEDEEKLKEAGFDEIVETKPKGMPLAEAMRPQRAVENIKEAARNYITAPFQGLMS